MSGRIGGAKPLRAAQIYFTSFFWISPNFRQTIAFSKLIIAFGADREAYEFRSTGGPGMNTLQAILLGAMMAWTPSLSFFAYMLWRAPSIEISEQSEEADYKPQ